MCDKRTHSLHATFSTGLHNNWYDLLKLAVPMAIDRAVEDMPQLRESVPRDLFHHLGVINDVPEGSDDRRKALQQQLVEMCASVLGQLPLDAAADQLARTFTHQRLPPWLSDSEQGHVRRSEDLLVAAVQQQQQQQQHATAGGSDKSGAGTRVNLDDYGVRLLRPRVYRLAVEDGHAVVYVGVWARRDRCVFTRPCVYRYSPMMNSRVYFGEPETRIPFPLAAAPAIETLLQLEPGDSVPVVDLVVVESDEGGDVATTVVVPGTDEPVDIKSGVDVLVHLADFGVPVVLTPLDDLE